DGDLVRAVRAPDEWRDLEQRRCQIGKSRCRVQLAQPYARECRRERRPTKLGVERERGERHLGDRVGRRERWIEPLYQEARRAPEGNEVLELAVLRDVDLAREGVGNEVHAVRIGAGGDRDGGEVGGVIREAVAAFAGSIPELDFEIDV